MTAEPTVTRLVTHVELNEARTTARQLDVSVRLEAELSNGRALVLLDDRGWAESGLGGDIREFLTPESLAETARTVVGPDEPYGDETHAQAEAAHWGALADRLSRRGVRVDATALAALPHDVVPDAALRAWAGFPEDRPGRGPDAA
ncbi:hypothetical protein ACIQJ4_29895 [Streptomyces filamentosus]|uniref:hypothetical protein n=1 Tax=Streptomyces filamentosus TaxID=67294 RepID=UPI00381A6D33